MAIEKSEFRGGISLQQDTVEEMDYYRQFAQEVSRLAPGEYNLTLPELAHGVYQYGLRVNEDGSGVFQMVETPRETGGQSMVVESLEMPKDSRECVIKSSRGSRDLARVFVYLRYLAD